jgi:PAS domain S-box-containing protein
MINQVKTKKQLLKNENRYRLLLDTLEAGIIIHASDTSIITNNDRAAELLGLSNEQMKGKSAIDAIWNFVNEENIPCAVHEYPVNIIVNSKKPIKNHIFGIHQPVNTNIVWVSVNGYPILDDKGDIIEIIINFIDISERKKAEQALQKSEERFRKIIETSPDGIAITAMDGTIQFVTAKVVSMWGYDDEAELLGRNSMEFVHPDYHEKAVYLITEMINGNLTGASEYLMVRKDGSTFHCEVNANIIRDANNVPTGILLIERDISERKLAEAALANRNTELKAIYDLSPVMMCLVDTNRQIIFANLAFTELSGTAEELLMGGHACGVFGCINAIDDVRGCGFGSNCQKCSLRIAMEDTFKNGTVHKNVEYHTTLIQNGVKREVSLLGSTALILSNNNRNLLLCLTDITGRKKAEKELRESEKRFRVFMDANNDYMFIKDNQFRYVFADKQTFGFFGKSEDEIIGKTDIELIGESVIAPCWSSDKKVLESNSQICFEEQIGDQIYEVTKFPLSLPEMENGIGGIMRNITERKQAENRILKHQRDLIEINRIGIIANSTLDKDTVLNLILENVTKALNVSVGMIFLKESESDLLKWGASIGLSEEFVNEFIISAIKVGEGLTGTIAKTRKPIFIKENSSNDPRVVRSVILKENLNSFLGVPLVAENELIGVMNILTRQPHTLSDDDLNLCSAIGSQVGLAISNASLYTQQQKVENDLIKAKDKAEESDRLKSAFLANMSHEIRTPMNGILGFAEILKEPDLTGEEQLKCIDIIEKSGTRMLNIINNIVDISRIEAGLMNLDIVETNINEQIEYIYTFFKPEVEAKGMKLSFNCPFSAKEATIITDREKVYAILSNLVKNAIKYSKEGSIDIGYALTHSELEFYVKDTGIGIPKDRQEAIFERFIQADIADKMAYQGAGLGLSITKSYIEMLGGKIWVESEEGVGAAFYFTLPYNTGLVSETVFDQLIPSGKTDYLKKLKILIAEDDDVSEMLITINVNDFSKEILKARTGVEAVEACRNNLDIDLVLMDIRMPEMSGYEAVQKIREFNKEVIIIAQTAHGLAGDKEKAIRSGCNDYISKPINKDELLRLLQKNLK